MYFRQNSQIYSFCNLRESWKVSNIDSSLLNFCPFNKAEQKNYREYSGGYGEEYHVWISYFPNSMSDGPWSPPLTSSVLCYWGEGKHELIKPIIKNMPMIHVYTKTPFTFVVSSWVCLNVLMSSSVTWSLDEGSLVSWTSLFRHLKEFKTIIIKK